MTYGDTATRVLLSERTASSDRRKSQRERNCDLCGSVIPRRGYYLLHRIRPVGRGGSGWSHIVECDQCAATAGRILMLLPTTDPPRKRLPASERFWRYVPPERPVDQCWEWSGTRNKAGYGTLGIKAWESPTGKDTARGAHRLSYEIHKGSIPPGFHIDHLCRNPPCVNPHHLEAVTPRENTLRGVGPAAELAKRTHCIRGHAFDEANTYRPPSNPRQRMCRACAAERGRRRRREKKQ